MTGDRFGWEAERWEEACEHTTHLILFSIEVEHDGSLAEIERFPSADQIKLVQAAAVKHNTKILVCFGGNSRSRGFSSVVASDALIEKFLGNLRDFLQEYQLDGVDYNWEYPQSEKDWRGLSKLVKYTKQRLECEVTVAYYPDSRQEMIIKHLGIYESADLIHSMSYDAVPGKHSTFKLAKKTVKQWQEARLPIEKLCLGLPFYARHVKTGDWKAYYDIYLDNTPLSPKKNFVKNYYYNGPDMIRKKVFAALKAGLGGVMIWEVGQDISKAKYGKDSLLGTITNTIKAFEENEANEARWQEELGARDIIDRDDL